MFVGLYPFLKLNKNSVTQSAIGYIARYGNALIKFFFSFFLYYSMSFYCQSCDSLVKGGMISLNRTPWVAWNELNDDAFLDCFPFFSKHCSMGVCMWHLIITIKIVMMFYCLGISWILTFDFGSMSVPKWINHFAEPGLSQLGSGHHFLVKELVYLHLSSGHSSRQLQGALWEGSLDLHGL